MESKLQRNRSSGSLARFKGFSRSIRQGYTREVVKDKSQPRCIDMQRSFSALNPSGDLESPSDDLSEVETVCGIGTVQRMQFYGDF